MNNQSFFSGRSKLIDDLFGKMKVKDNWLWRYQGNNVNDNLYVYPDNISKYWRYYALPNQRLGIVQEITKYERYIIVNISGKIVVYGRLSWDFWDNSCTYVIMYNRELCKFYVSRDGFNKYIGGYHKWREINEPVRSLADFVRFLRVYYKTEFDPSLVDYGTMIYKKKPDNIGVSLGGRLTDLTVYCL